QSSTSLQSPFHVFTNMAHLIPLNQKQSNNTPADGDMNGDGTRLVDGAIMALDQSDPIHHADAVHHTDPIHHTVPIYHTDHAHHASLIYHIGHVHQIGPVNRNDSVHYTGP